LPDKNRHRHATGHGEHDGHGRPRRGTCEVDQVLTPFVDHVQAPLEA